MGLTYFSDEEIYSFLDKELEGVVLEVEQFNDPLGALVQQVLRLQTLNVSQTRLLLNCLHFFLKRLRTMG